MTQIIDTEATFFMADLVTCLLERFTTQSNHQSFSMIDTNESYLNTNSTVLIQPSETGSSTSRRNSVIIIMLFANLIYMVLSFILLGIFAKVRVAQRENKRLERKALAEEEKVFHLSSIMSFVFLLLSLLCRLITCTLILMHVMGLLEKD